ncbi:ferric iron reductase protein FhuF [Salirhabdus euzebyi]|uniref:Ferric iron reductase protein FhuF n=1 Tax=Salirhabdus euzebyi TaxID=394506 RepID=A0A841Q505_9BACI|nr:(2Fe-2S)-binding protein [Salirhabdus euzebyi]MBB6453474.1 ferric iron reductase protein FhuF [Salirhabdus euzebyi]
MTSRLVTEEKNILNDNFRLVFEKNGQEVIPLESFLNHQFLHQYLLDLKDRLGAESLLAASSQFVKRLGFIITIPFLYSMSMFNKQLDVSFKNYYLVPRDVDNIWLPQLFLSDSITKELMGLDRDEARQKHFIQIVENVKQLLDAVSCVGKVPKPILWENVAIYIYWLYEKRLETDVENEKTHIQDDFQYLLQKIPANIFGEAVNPFLKFYGNECETNASNAEIRIRKTCCFYYEANEEKSFCSTCPKAIRNCK